MTTAATTPSLNSIALVVERLVAALAPLRIYVFGSVANGGASAESDLDLLIVVPRDRRNKLRNTREAYLALQDMPFPKDIVVDDEETFLERMKWTSSIEHEATARGRLIYASKS